MKSNKGITLTSLIIYIIVLMLVLGILSVISRFFYRNLGYVEDLGDYVSEYNKFNMFFLEDAKKNKSIISISNDNKQITFGDGTVYTYKSGEDKSIYRNKVKVCRNVESCMFEKKENDNDKDIISVQIYMDNSSLVKFSTDYVLRYW